jgi:hypothetical protein
MVFTKKLFATLIALTLVITTLSGCTDAKSDDEDFTVVETQLQSVAITYGSVKDKQMVDLFFDEDGFPYLDLNFMLDLMKKELKAFTVTEREENVFDIKFEFREYVLTKMRLTPDQVAQIDTITFDFNNDTIEYHDFLIQNIAIDKTDIHVNVNPELEGFEEYEENYTIGTRQVIDLPNYDYDLKITKHDKEYKYLVPVEVHNLFFTLLYRHMIFNGEELFVTRQDDIGERKDKFHENAVEYEVNEKNILRNYNFLRLVFDNFYGQKVNLGLENFDDYAPLKAIYDNRNNITTGEELTRYYYEFLYSLDDSHTGFRYPGFYGDINTPTASEIYEMKGPKSRVLHDFYWNETEYYAHCDYEGAVVNTYGDTSIISFASFDYNVTTDIKTTLERTESPKIVLDLRCNGGGSIAEVYRIISLISDKPIVLNYGNGEGNGNDSYFNHVVSYGKNNYIEKDYYLLISPYTYSAANELSLYISDNDTATILGQTTGGGLSSVGTTALPDGTIIRFSSRYSIYNKDFKLVEQGTAPDIFIEDFWNDELIVETINGLESK